MELRGPGLPKQGANWGGESVGPPTWDPGNPGGATQQRVTTTRDDNSQSAATALQNAAQGAIAAAQSVIQQSNANLKNSASRFTLGQLESFALYPQTLVKSITTQLGRIVLAFND